MISEIYFEDLPVGIVVDIKIHRQGTYDRIKLERVVPPTEILEYKEVVKYYGKPHNLLSKNQKGLDPSTNAYAEAVKKAVDRVKHISLTRYIFRHNAEEESYLIIPITPTTVETTKISLPDLNIF